MFEPVRGHDPAAARARALERRRAQIREGAAQERGGPRVIRDEYDATAPAEAASDATQDRGLPHTGTEEARGDRAREASIEGGSGDEAADGDAPRLDLSA